VRNLPKAPAVLVRPTRSAIAAFEDDEAPGLAIDAIAGVAAWTPARHDKPAVVARAAEPASADDGSEDVLAFGAFGWIDVPKLAAPGVETHTQATTADDPPDEPLAVGAVVSCLEFDTPALVAKTRAAPQIVESAADLDELVAYGAAANVAQLLDLAPPPPIFTPPPVVDLEVVALDDFLADACEALYVAAFDPTELYAWGASELAGGSDVAAQLAACESALWKLPRTIPCGEAFACNPNHEIAVKITRALRVRADTLRARAFADHVNFGALCALQAHTPWFPSIEAPLEPGDDTVDADTQFATWGMDDLATIITAPDRSLPILSEAELEDLLATPASGDSHELEENWQENPVWQETFWHDVDAYLQSVESDAYHEHPAQQHAKADNGSDFEVRDENVAPIATHFWLPGDEHDLAITGEGTDLFLIGGGDAGVVLIEDGAIHSMRTGRGTRMGEVVVSWSTDTWSDIDAMTWTRVATLSGVSQLHVEQTASHDRMVVVAGDLSGSALIAARVRLVEATEDGPRTFPVRCIGGLDAGDWSFTDAGEANSDESRFFV